MKDGSSLIPHPSSLRKPTTRALFVRIPSLVFRTVYRQKDSGSRTMNTNFERIRHIFLTIVEQPSTQWEALLDETCDDDPELRQQVALLLKTHAEGEGILDRNEGGRGPTGIYESLSERPGTMVGPYKLLQQIGEGGMGTVFMAEQTQPVQRKVALKVIKPGMDSRQVIARFEAERQALAMMDHVNIPPVLEAGPTQRTGTRPTSPSPHPPP